MSVLIKGMEMPKSCSECRFCAWKDENDVGCAATGKGADDCPLIELPDHGDLIDRAAALEEIESFYPPKVRGESEAEEINRVGWECAINCIEAYLRTVKPVIPAERGEA